MLSHHERQITHQKEGAYRGEVADRVREKADRHAHRRDDQARDRGADHGRCVED